MKACWSNRPEKKKGTRLRDPVPARRPGAYVTPERRELPLTYEHMRPGARRAAVNLHHLNSGLPGAAGQEGTTVNTNAAEPVPDGKTSAPGTGEYLAGVHEGWHAIAPDALQYAGTTRNGIQIVPAECGQFVRLAPKYGAYVRAEVPVTHDPCPECGWIVAVATGTVDREIRLITPDRQEAAALVRLGADPLLPGALCRAVLAAAEDPSGPAVIRQLAAVTRHRPGLAISEECAEGGCGHRPCTYPGSLAVCWACSLRTGDEAGEWHGQLMAEATVTALCGTLAALAAHYELLPAGEQGMASS